MLIHVSLHPVALKEVVPTNYPATTEPHGLRRPKSTNALIARSRSKRQRHDPPRLRRARRERLCRRRAAEQRYEFAPSHRFALTSIATAYHTGMGRDLVRHSKIEAAMSLMGPNPERLSASICRPVLPQEQTSLLRAGTSASCRLCCKSPKLPGDKFPATRRTNRRPAICVASIALPSRR